MPSPLIETPCLPGIKILLKPLKCHSRLSLSLSLSLLPITWSSTGDFFTLRFLRLHSHRSCQLSGLCVLPCQLMRFILRLKMHFKEKKKEREQEKMLCPFSLSLYLFVSLSLSLSLSHSLSPSSSGRGSITHGLI